PARAIAVVPQANSPTVTALHTYRTMITSSRFTGTRCNVGSSRDALDKPKEYARSRTVSLSWQWEGSDSRPPVPPHSVTLLRSAAGEPASVNCESGARYLHSPQQAEVKPCTS